MKKRILICEDVISLNDQMTEIASDYGEVNQTYNEEDTLELLTNYYYDIGIIDFNLEGKKITPIWRDTGGMHVVQYIKELDYGTGCIVVTGNKDTRLAFDLGREYGSAVFDYLEKGITGFSDKLENSLSKYEKESRINFPDNELIFLSRIKNGIDREHWVTTVIRALSMKGGAGTLIEISKHILRTAYPMVFANVNPGLNHNAEMGKLHAVAWSLKYGHPIDITVSNVKDASVETDNLISNKRIENVVISICKNNMDREKFENHKIPVYNLIHT